MGTTLVTGGKGFLGRHMVARLAGIGDNVRILARNPEQYASDKSPHETIWGDIRNREIVDRAVKGVDTVIHLVSNYRHPGSDKDDAYAVNVDGTINVLEASLRHDVQRVVHCSTTAVYGDVKEIPATEQTPFNPHDLYQETKLIAEERIWEFHKKTGLPVTVIRPISMIGPGDMRMLKLFKGIQNRTFFIIGSGEVFFQPAYVEDVVEGFMLAKDHPAAVGESFIVGSEEFTTLNNMVEMIANILDVEPRRLKLPLIPFLWAATIAETICAPLGIEPPLHHRRMSFFQNNRAFSIEKAQQILGYRPQRSLRESLQRTVEWYRANDYL